MKKDLLSGLVGQPEEGGESYRTLYNGTSVSPCKCGFSAHWNGEGELIVNGEIITKGPYYCPDCGRKIYYKTPREEKGKRVKNE